MTNTKSSRGVVCHYCHNPGHVRHNCRKLQNKNRRFQSVHHQKSLKSASTSITTLAESSKTNTCFLSSFSTWVVDFGATDHMIGNSSLFTTFQFHPSTSTATFTDGSRSYVLGSKTIHPTPLITLTYVLSLPQFFFNLIYVSKLILTLNCSISFFANHCLIQDLSTKWIICQDRESGGLYIFEIKVPKLVACSGIVTPFELHCRLCHPSLFVEETISSVSIFTEL